MTGSVQLNKGKWYCVLDFKDENGKRKLKWFSTGLTEKGNKKKAQAILKDLIKQHEGHEVITNYAKMPFVDYCDFWLKGKKESIESTTYEGYEYRIAHIKQFFSDRKTILSKLNQRDIKEFYEYLLTEGNMAKYKRNNGLSQRSIKEIALILKAILKEATLLGDISSNPSENIPVPKKKQESIKQEVFIDKEDMGVLLKSINGHILEDVIIVTLFYGLRRSEVLGLKWDAVDFEGNTLQIKHTVVKVKSKIAKDTAKTEESHRTYPLPDYIKEKLIKIKNRQQRNKRLFGEQYVPSDYIFTWDDGHLLTPDYVTKTFKKIVNATDELPADLKFHDLRKSCVSMMVEEGYSIKEIQKWVGHADVETTLNIYAKVKESRKAYIGKNMEEMFKQKSIC